MVSGVAPSQADEPAAKPAVFSSEKLGRIDDFFNNEVATGKIPGAMVLIKQHGRQVYFKTFGMSDTDTGRPMTPEEWATIRSMARKVLPVLVGPSTAVMVCRSTVSESPSTATLSPYRITSPSTATAGSAAGTRPV